MGLGGRNIVMNVKGIVLDDREGFTLRSHGLARADQHVIELLQLALLLAVLEADDGSARRTEVIDQIDMLELRIARVSFLALLGEIEPFLGADVHHRHDLLLSYAAAVGPPHNVDAAAVAHADEERASLDSLERRHTVAAAPHFMGLDAGLLCGEPPQMRRYRFRIECLDCAIQLGIGDIYQTALDEFIGRLAIFGIELL